MDWYTRALAITPLASQTRSKGPAAYGGTPLYAIGGHGSKIILPGDQPGEERWLVDWVCGLGAISLGYRHPAVDAAIETQLRCYGISLSLPHRLEIEVGEHLREIIPCMQPDGMVRFVKTGSEACEAAVRIARKATGKDIVLTVGAGYHGWHSWFQAVKPDHPGVPAAYTYGVESFTYNDLTSLERKLQWFDGRIACVLMEPTLFEAPGPAFLQDIRRLCTSSGIVLIFDEMVTGFRLARAGGQERFGVVPDLAVFGKGLANGMPLACVVGKKDLMQHADVVSGTFGGECLSLAAAHAVLQVYEDTGVCGHLERIGTALTEALEGLAQSCQLNWVTRGWPAVAQHSFDFYDPETNEKALALFTQEMHQQGILWHPRIRYASLAHTPEDVDRTVTAATIAMQKVVLAEYDNDWSALTGPLPVAPFARKVS